MSRLAVLPLLSRHVARLAFALAVCAMFVRVVVPAGFMPDPVQAAQGKIQLVLCTSNGPITTWLDVSDAHDDSSSFISEPCPFGMMASSATLPMATVTSALTVASSRPVVSQNIPSALPVQPATGPPVGLRAPPTFIL